MNENETPKNTGQALAQRITNHIQELAEATDAALLSGEMQRYLETYSRFHQYSTYNIFCILMTNPNASVVAGFNKWKSLGRFVRKGEHGIPILAPIVFKEDPGDPNSRELIGGFRVVYVFDVSQTMGEPLPEPPDWKSPEKNMILSARLITFAESRGITVNVKKLSGETQGVSKGGAIEIDPSAGTKTLIHEIAHELMHRDANRPDDPKIRELEAEAVAYVVGKHFSLEATGSPNYLALHGIEARLIMKYLDRIAKTSAEIINALEKETDDAEYSALIGKPVKFMKGVIAFGPVRICSKELIVDARVKKYSLHPIGN